MRSVELIRTLRDLHLRGGLENICYSFKNKNFNAYLSLKFEGVESSERELLTFLFEKSYQLNNSNRFSPYLCCTLIVFHFMIKTIMPNSKILIIENFNRFSLFSKHFIKEKINIISIKTAYSENVHLRNNFCTLFINLYKVPSDSDLVKIETILFTIIERKFSKLEIILISTEEYISKILKIILGFNNISYMRLGRFLKKIMLLWTYC